MSEYLTITANRKEEVYDELLPQLKGLVDGEPNLIANLANTASALKLALPVISWVGFYLYDGKELVLGPFQGKPACVRIAPGIGVCGTAFSERRTLIVPDVRQFPGHIACDPDSLSEIVLPIEFNGRRYGVLDLDSTHIATFDEVDAAKLRHVLSLLAPSFHTVSTYA